MNGYLKISAALGIVAMLAACNKSTPDQMAKDAGKIMVEVLPTVLTEVDGKVDAKLELTFPKKFFRENALMIVTPVLVYEGGETVLSPFAYQGEKVKENNKVVAYDGATMTESVSFIYKEAMRSSRLELRPVVVYAGNQYAVPAWKVADGIVTTARLAATRGRCDYKADGYQTVLHRTAEARILYDVNSSSLKKSELNGGSVEDYQDKIERIKQNDRYTITSTQIVSYASPEGGKKYNEKLSDKRSDSAMKAWKTIGKGMAADELDIQSIGQDWEGFKEAVAKSDIRDKDLILRVLSMYNDPAVRESEIRNLSQIYTELKSEVFPELRRSRFITNLDYRNYSDEDLEILAQQKLYMLDESGLLHLAGVTESSARKEFIYNFAYEKFGSKTALFNLAAQAIEEGNPTKATIYLDKLSDEEDPEVINARGVIELYNRNWYKSEDLFEKAATDQSKQNLGTLYMLQGNYGKAAKMFADDSADKPVALIMAGQYDEAARLLKDGSSRSEYLLAIIAARKGETSAVKSHLATACKDPYYAEMEKTDVEFAKYRQ